jgi:hypothetical protein
MDFQIELQFLSSITLTKYNIGNAVHCIIHLLIRNIHNNVQKSRRRRRRRRPQIVEIFFHLLSPNLSLSFTLLPYSF